MEFHNDTNKLRYFTSDLTYMVIKSKNGGRWMICHFSSPFCFLLIGLHCTFSISYKILTNYV